MGCIFSRKLKKLLIKLEKIGEEKILPLQKAHCGGTNYSNLANDGKIILTEKHLYFVSCLYNIEIRIENIDNVEPIQVKFRNGFYVETNNKDYYTFVVRRSNQWIQELQNLKNKKY